MSQEDNEKRGLMTASQVPGRIFFAFAVHTRELKPIRFQLIRGTSESEVRPALRELHMKRRRNRRQAPPRPYTFVGYRLRPIRADLAARYTGLENRATRVARHRSTSLCRKVAGFQRSPVSLFLKVTFDLLDLLPSLLGQLDASVAGPRTMTNDRGVKATRTGSMEVSV
jgi:hypothetical protein